MIELTDQVLNDVVSAVVAEVHPERIILFGSRSTGKAEPDSDLDLLIEEAKPFAGQRSRFKEITRIRRALAAFRIAKDILVYSSDEVAKWRNSRNHIVSACFRDGKTLYERS